MVLCIATENKTNRDSFTVGLFFSIESLARRIKSVRCFLPFYLTASE
ncbi:hypothetical protein CA54_29830 [Symmachiella macrocystis]|uniref:Uncharacterized protein n=1 Tax=Symmachiella macrocystis TaxID=2527985 RepID=A0A5C6BPK4_9PLAN|nr:hypothetical protein CA54_29830 [Symmachiella macrocystis]